MTKSGLKGTSGKTSDRLGKIVFSPQRTDHAPKDEKNSYIENLLKMAFDDHIVRNNDLENDQKDLINSFLSDSSYSDFFYPPKSPEVYRGLVIRRGDKKILEKWLGTSNIQAQGEVEGNWVVSPLTSAVASYTTDLSIAKKFAKWDESLSPIAPGPSYAVILSANVSDNQDKLLDLTELYHRISPFDEFSQEKETVALGPINIYKISWKLRNIAQ